MISITTLEKSIKLLERKVQEKGFETEIDVFKSGPNPWGELESSYVDLEVYGNDDSYTCYRFKAGGYSSTGYNRTYGGESIREMKRQFWNEFEKDFPESKQLKNSLAAKPL